jgi:hypothetical protein
MNLHIAINTVILDESSHGNDDILAYGLMHKYIKRYCKLKMVSFLGDIKLDRGYTLQALLNI